jgi:hypothetical protein
MERNLLVTGASAPRLRKRYPMVETMETNSRPSSHARIAHEPADERPDRTDPPGEKPDEPRPRDRGLTRGEELPRG